MVAETPRLVVRRLTVEDAPFIVALLNDPAFLANIGDKNVRTLDDAVEYIRAVPLASYATHGFGHYLVELKSDHRAIGICSLVARAWLADVDLGFAYLPDFRGHGYAAEAAAAVMEYARAALGFTRLVAIVSPGNRASIALLEKLGFRLEGAANPPGESKPLSLYRRTLEAPDV